MNNPSRYSLDLLRKMANRAGPRRRKALLLLLACWSAAPAFARFLDKEGDQIDPEEKIGSQTFNDELSYRPPFHWVHIWQQNDLAFRINAGSYNADRFMYEQDIKLTTDVDNPAVFSFEQERQHDRLGDFDRKHIKLQINSWKPFIFSIMADGNSYKRDGDLGASLGLDLEQVRIEGYAWSVNHFYNQKKEETKNHFDRKPRTYGLTARYQIESQVQFTAHWEEDTPLHWDRVSDGFYYEYEQTRWGASLALGDPCQGFYQDFRWQRSFKHEMKDWYAESDSSDFRKELNRQWYEVEYQLTWVDANFNLSNGVWYTNRHASYQYLGKDGFTENENELPESLSPTRRHGELATYHLFFHKLYKDTLTGLQYGLFNNFSRFSDRTLTSKDRTEYHSQIKFQLAWSYQIAAGSHLLLNTTWDVDGMVVEYPYTDDNQFRPWDGGALQILATF